MKKVKLIDDFKTYLSTLKNEATKRRIFYVLDYILNYFTGDRREPALDELGFHEEVAILSKMKIIIIDNLTWRGHSYKHMFINPEVSEEIKNILKNMYYPLLTEDYLKRKISQTVKENLKGAIEFWNKVVMFDGTQYTLSGFEEYNPLVVEFGKKLSQNEIGYFINYWTSSWSTHCKDFIFRKHPIDARKIFLEVVEEKINKLFISFTPAMRWCIYLNYIYPLADEEFFLLNSTSRFLPAEIKSSLSQLPSLKLARVKSILLSLIEKEKERIKIILKNFLQRDPSLISILHLLILIGKKEEKYIEVTDFQLNKLRELSSDEFWRVFSFSLEHLHTRGVILKTQSNSILIPSIVSSVLDIELRGGSTDVRTFESPLDARAFIEEEIAKATFSVKIWDPYVTAETLRIIEMAVKPTISIKILTSLPQIIKEVIRMRNKGFNIHICVIYKKKDGRPLSPFHDRYVIIDDKIVWHFGPSLHAAGSKGYESAVKLPENECKIYIDAFNYNFEKKSEEDWKKEGYELKRIGGMI